MAENGLLIVISGPSGTGKGTVCTELLTRHPLIAYSISATTRPPRPGEKDGQNYYFLDKDVFQQMIAKGELLEWAEVYGNYYGTPLSKIKDKLVAGQDVLLEIDTQGALNVMKNFPHGIYIYLVPPSLSELEKRIRGRGSENEESITRRLNAACDEIELGKKYAYIVVNTTVSHAVSNIASIIESEHSRTKRNMDLLTALKKRKD